MIVLIRKKNFPWRLRYREKMDFINEKIKYFDVTPMEQLEKWGLYYAIQTSIDSLYDIIAMLVKDLGLQVKDDANNLEAIVEEREISLHLREELKAAKGMRNFLVHQYNGINEKIVMKSIPKLKALIENWLTEIEMVLNEFEDNRED